MQLTVRDHQIGEECGHSFFQTVFAEQSITRQTLLAFAIDFLKLLLTKRNVLEFDYRIRMDNFLEPGKRMTFPLRGARTVKVGGQCGYVQGGPSECYIETMVVLADGRGRRDRRIDLREFDHFETDNAGTIDIIRRPVTLNWFSQLPAAITFLEQSDAFQVLPKVVWGRPTILQLIKRLHVGDDLGGGIGEELFQMGEEGRDGLYKLLANGRQRKYHGTVVNFLCTVFPSQTTQSAVLQAIEQVRDEETKRSFRAMLDQMKV